MSRTLILTLSLLALVRPSSVHIEPEDTTAVVAAWNVLDTPSERAANVAAGITFLDPEVILLSEARRQSQMAPLLQALEDAGGHYNLHMVDQTASDHIAILAKDHVSVSNVRLLADSDAGNSNLRKALLADVKVGQFDFFLVGLHLKAGRSSADRETRNNQVEEIATFIANATQGEEKDVLVVGDYNMIPPSATDDEDKENFDGMNPNGFLQFISSEDLQGEGSHISSGGSMGNLLDGYAISQAHTGEYVEGSLRIFPLHRAFQMDLADYRDDVSDHLPLVARFLVTEDDD